MITRGKKKGSQQQSNTEEGIPVRPIKHKRGGSDKAKEPATSTAQGKEPSKKQEKKKSTQPPAATENQQPQGKKTQKKVSQIDLDKGL